jgi:hypothetical protein
MIKNDSIFFLKVYSSSWNPYKNYVADISLSPQKFLELNKILQSKNHSHDGCFIFKVSEIITILPQIKSGFDFNGEDSYSYLEYDFDETLLIFKGELIDLYLNVIIPEKNE